MPVTLHEIHHGGLTRSYRLHLPGRLAERPALLAVLHGAGGDARLIARITRFDEVSEREGLIAVYPEAVDKAWNDGRRPATGSTPVHEVDDAGFLAMLIETLVRQHGLDPARVFVTGASNGAMMCHRLACERSELVGGLGMVMGSIPAGLYDTLAPSRPVPALLINGTSDPIVPWKGGPVRVGTREHGQVVSVEDCVAFWVRHNRAAAAAEREWLPKTGDGETRAWRQVYPAHDTGADVVFYGVDGGGHTWPGGEQYLAEWIIGKTNRDFDASQTIWQFFQGIRV